MTASALDIALRAYCKRRPFQPFSIEFNSGGLLIVSHPEAIRRAGELFMFRSAQGRYELFAAENVSRLMDPEADTE